MRLLCVTLLVLVCHLSFHSSSLQATGIDWYLQYGTSSTDAAGQVSLDGQGNLYVVGGTRGSFPGFTNAGATDAYLEKRDTAGNLIWREQFGISLDDAASYVSHDSLGNVYVSGLSYGSLDGTAPHGDFISKFDSTGNMQWIKQIEPYDLFAVSDMRTDAAGNMYLVGTTFTNPNTAPPGLGYDDVFVSKYDSNGDEVWRNVLGTFVTDQGYALTLDGAGNIYFSGYTEGNFSGDASGDIADGFLAKMDPNGNAIWIEQFGETGRHDAPTAITTDANGNVYLAGLNPTLHPNTSDLFVTKFDPDGNLIWTRGLASSEDEFSSSIVVDGQGGLYVAGSTKSNLPGATHAGGTDIFLVKYDLDGNLLEVNQYGTSGNESPYSILADGTGGLYMTGRTNGALFGGTALGGDDAFLLKLDTTVVPEPSALALVAMGLLGLVLFARRAKRSL